MSSSKSENYPTGSAYDLATTLWMLSMGPGDPCLQKDHAGRVRMVLPGPTGPVVLDLQNEADRVHVQANGADADWVVPFLPALLGLDYQPPRLEQPRRLQALAQRYAGMRLPRLPVVFPRLVQIVLQQLVSFRDAMHGWRQLVRRHGAAVPGHDDLIAPPTAQALARLAPFEYAECGILPQFGRRISGLARVAKKIEAAWDAGAAPNAADRTCRLLEKLPGVGPWTIGYLRGSGLGDSDAVVLDDYGFPQHVSYFFTGDEQATDDDMRRLLEPYRAHRFYVLSLILKGAPTPPRRGPRRKSVRDRLRPPQ